MKEDKIKELIDEAFKHYGRKKISLREFLEFFEQKKNMKHEDAIKLFGEASAELLIDVGVKPSQHPETTDNNIILEYLTPEEREIVKIENEILDKHFEEEILPKIERELQLTKPKKKKRQK